MKERQILFSAPMVRSLLAGTKTQTRRAVKNPERYEGGVHNCLHCCPYGQPGDRLLVREVWRASLAHELSPPRDIPSSSPILYEAGGGALPVANAGRKRPSMFMPRWASRILLDVTEVRVERLQDINEADAVAEGMSPSQPNDKDARHMYSLKWAYEILWDQINGASAWHANPWVWAVSFKRVIP